MLVAAWSRSARPRSRTRFATGRPRSRGTVGRRLPRRRMSVRRRRRRPRRHRTVRHRPPRQMRVRRHARLPGGAASGLLAFTAAGACELRAIDLRSGRMLELPRLETSCALYAPRVGSRVAYSTLDDAGGLTRHFSILDLENPRASFGEYLGWTFRSPGARTARRSPGATPLESGFELSRGQRPKRLDHCPRAYDPSGVTASVNDRQQIVVGGRPLLKARGRVWHSRGASTARSPSSWREGGSTATRADAWWARRA